MLPSFLILLFDATGKHLGLVVGDCQRSQDLGQYTLYKANIALHIKSMRREHSNSTVLSCYRSFRRVGGEKRPSQVGGRV